MKGLATIGAFLLICGVIAPAGAQDSKGSSTASAEIAGFHCTNGTFVSAAAIAGTAVGQMVAEAVARKGRVAISAIIGGGSGKAAEWGAPQICEAIATWWNGNTPPATERHIIATPQPIVIPHEFVTKSKSFTGEERRPITFGEKRRTTFEELLNEPRKRDCPAGTFYGELSQSCLPN